MTRARMTVEIQEKLGRFIGGKNRDFLLPTRNIRGGLRGYSFCAPPS